MSQEYFGGAPNAFQGGIEFARLRRQREQEERLRSQQEASRNAIVSKYGVIAGDPVALGQVEGIRQRQEIQPHVLAAAELDNVRVAQSAEAADITQRTMIGQRIAQVLEKATPEGIGAAFDFAARGLVGMGVPQEQIPQIREELVTGGPAARDQFAALLRKPADSADGERRLIKSTPMQDDATGKWVQVQEFSDGSESVVGGYSPASAELRERTLDQQLYPAREAGTLTVVDQNSPNGIRQEVVQGSAKAIERRAADRNIVQGYATISNHSDVLQRNAARAVGYFKDASGGVILRTIRSGMRRLPGTPSNDAWDALETIKNNVAIDELQRMRQASPTGGALGNVSDRDISLLSGALGRLEVERDPKRLVEDINEIVRMYEDILDFAKEDADAAQARLNQQQSSAPASPAPGDDLDALINKWQ